MRFFLSASAVAAASFVPASAFVSPSCSASSVRTFMKADGFSDWMQPDGQDYDTHPHPRNTPSRPASALEQWQQQQYELRQQEERSPMMRTEQQLSQWQQAQKQKESFAFDPYGTNGPARYGYGIGPPPPQQQMRQQQQPPQQQQMQQPPQQQMQQQQQPPQQQQGPPMQQQGPPMQQQGPPMQQQMQQRPSQPRQQSPMDQFIENPYGNRPAPDGYYDQGGSPGSFISPSTARFDQQVRSQRDFMDSTSGTNRMEYGYGTSSKETPGRVVVPAPNRRNQRKAVSRLDNFINNPRGSTFTAGQYGYGNDGDNGSGYYDYYNDGGNVP
jgi:hypothetical protein